MATAATIKKNIAKLEAALKSKATPKSLKPKLETQLVKSKAELSGMNKGTKPKTSSTKSTQTALQKLKAMVNKNKKYKTYKGAGVDLEKDADRPALRTGKRVTDGTHYPYKKGNVYYEYRANRIDVKQPPKKYPKLEKGGYMAKGGETKVAKFKVEDMVYSYQNKDYAAPINYVKFNPWDSNSSTHPNDTYKYRLSLKDGNSKWIDEKSLYKTKQKEYAKGGYMAKGGEINGNLEIVDFYVNEYPKDDIAVDINPKATFNGLYQILKNKGDAYKYIGVGDSVVRERVFQKLAEIKGVKYDVIYDMWMESDYAKGGYMADGGEVWTIGEYQTIEDWNSATKKDGTKTTINAEGYPIRKNGVNVYVVKSKKEAIEKVKRLNSKLEQGGYMADGGISDKEVAESNAEMVLSQIKAVKHHAQELSNVVSKNSDIEAWVVAKIERASTDLSDITHYLEFQTKKMAMGGEIHRTQD